MRRDVQRDLRSFHDVVDFLERSFHAFHIGFRKRTDLDALSFSCFVVSSTGTEKRANPFRIHQSNLQMREPLSNSAFQMSLYDVHDGKTHTERLLLDSDFAREFEPFGQTIQPFGYHATDMLVSDFVLASVPYLEIDFQSVFHVTSLGIQKRKR